MPESPVSRNPQSARRVKLLALDQEKLKASVERGANLVDYMELDKIETRP